MQLILCGQFIILSKIFPLFIVEMVLMFSKQWCNYASDKMQTKWKSVSHSDNLKKWNRHYRFLIYWSFFIIMQLEMKLYRKITGADKQQLGDSYNMMEEMNSISEELLEERVSIGLYFE